MRQSITNPIVFISLYSASSNLKNRQIFTSLLMAGVADIRRINDEHSARIGNEQWIFKMPISYWEYFFLRRLIILRLTSGCTREPY